MSRWWFGFWLVVLAGACGGVWVNAAEEAPLSTAGPVPLLLYTKPGQFEIIVVDAVDARSALGVGAAVWGALAGPLELPAEGFNTPVSVRLVPVAQWTAPTSFTVTAETPGLVSVRVRWAAGEGTAELRRAMVHGLILRQAVSWYGVVARITVPLWLEQGFTGLSRVRERPALLDSFQQESARIVTPPSLAVLFQGQRGRDRELASLWLVLQLQAEAESSGANHWHHWLRGVVVGADPLDTLPQIYSGLWRDAAALELWWQTSFYHQARSRTLPVMTAVESRTWLADRRRWLAGRQGREVVLPLAELSGLCREPWVRTELAERIRQAYVILPLIHPFYANATLSLGRLYEAALKGNDTAVRVALAELDRDTIDGRELENIVGAILDTAPTK